jgi:hypothetical protein
MSALFVLQALIRITNQRHERFAAGEDMIRIDHCCSSLCSQFNSSHMCEAVGQQLQSLLSHTQVRVWTPCAAQSFLPNKKYLSMTL